MTTELQETEIKQYYDEHVMSKLGAFVNVNPRVERAWNTIRNWAPSNPKRILEVGCGVGDVVWRMSRYWPDAEVVGLDISPKSIEIATKMFGLPKVKFEQGLLVPGALTGPFDLIVFMDVYEHIAVADRPSVHASIRELLSKNGRVVFAVPTPRHLAWLKVNDPANIQPVDEDIDVEVLSSLAKDTGTEILFYQEVGIWHEGDYAHAVLSPKSGWSGVPCGRGGLKRKLRELVTPKRRPPTSSRAQRLAIVNKALAPDRYPG